MDKLPQKDREAVHNYLDIAGIMFVGIDFAQKVTLINKKGCEILGFAENEIIGKNWFDEFVPQRIREEVRTVFTRLLHGETEIAEYYENPVLNKSGTERIIFWHNTVLKDENGSIFGTISSGEDITERKRAEDTIKKLSHQNELVLNAVYDGIYGIDLNGNTTFINSSATKMLGWTLEELAGRSMHETMHHTKPDGTPYRTEDCPIYDVLKNGVVKRVEDEVFWKKDGTSFPVRYTSTPVLEHNKIVGAVITFEDVVELRQKEKEKERFVYDLTERAKELKAINKTNAILRNEGKAVSEIMLELTTILQEAWQYPEITAVRIKYDNAEFTTPNFRESKWCQRGNFTIDDDYGIIEVFYLEEKPDEVEGPFLSEERILLNNIADILRTSLARRLANEAIIKFNTFLLSIREINEALLIIKDEDELFNKICESLIRAGFITFVWVGVIEKGSTEVKPVAQRGFEHGFLASIKIKLDEPSSHLDPVGMAIHTGEIIDLWDIEKDSIKETWREETLKRGYLSSVAVPLKHEEEIVGVLCVYSDKKYAFGEEEIDFLKEVANDITVGIKSLWLERELKRSVDNLRKGLNGTIEAVSLMAEVRDYYTSGHQKRVAQLSCAIANEMGMTEDQIEGVRISALLHDIGKIIVPSDILSKPTKLTDYEFNNIKAHVQVGYDILKGLEFPWPVAKVVLQHHEKLNGAGYPSGLKGDEIIKEARILVVSDVVEAMMNHRPYRPALGMDKALEEILQNKGVLYDTDVVNACVNLFKKKGFQFDK